MTTEQHVDEQLVQLQGLTEADWDLLKELTALLVAVLSSDKGAAVVMADAKGNGVGLVHAIGNQELIPALMASAAMASHAMFTNPDGAQLQ